VRGEVLKLEAELLQQQQEERRDRQRQPVGDVGGEQNELPCGEVTEGDGTSADPLGERWGTCWGEGEDATLRSMPSPISLHQRRRRPAVFALRPARRRTKTHGEVAPSHGIAQHWSPRAIRPVITGHALSLRSTGLICKGFSVITVCNSALMRIFQGEPRNLRAHASLILDAGHSDTYKYPRTVPLRGQINRAFAISN
jgi:hypothetical protein